MRQGLGAPKGKWQGNPQGGVATPDVIILPNPATRFLRSAERLETLATGHPMQDWLHLMAQLSHRIGIMLKGELVEVGDVQQISAAPAHAYTRKLWAAVPFLPARHAASAVTA